MDSVDYVTLMLIDKGYYDYDYQDIKRKKVEDVAPRNKAETQKLVARFGVGTAKPKETNVADAETKAEDIQRMVMESVGEVPLKQNKNN